MNLLTTLSLMLLTDDSRQIHAPIMEEKEILNFRNRAVSYFEQILVAEGYDRQRASDLAFFVAKVLEDTLALVEDVENNNQDTNNVLDHIHMMYSNKFAFEEGHKILMYKDQEV